MSLLSLEQTPAAVTTGKTGNNNALTHGGTSQKLILPNENQSDFEALLQGLRAEYQPETVQQHCFIEQLAMGHWFLWRRQRAFHSLETLLYERDPDPISWVDDDFHRLALAERYKISAERALKRAFQNAESIRKERKSQQDHLERHAKWQAEQAIRERRIALQEAKQKAAETRKKAQPTNTETPSRPPIQWPTGPVGIPWPEDHPSSVLTDPDTRSEHS